MKTINLRLLFLFALAVLTACNEDPDTNLDEDKPVTLPDASYIASFEQATEDVLRTIPKEYINKARNELHVAYQHTSHGTHVSYGVFGLQDYKPGDEVLFGVTNRNPTAGKLDFRDNVLSAYAPNNVDASDLSRDETAFIQSTRNYLDDPDNAEVNVVMWSWCDIAGHNVSDHYLVGMEALINEYSEGGSKIGTGQRSVPVHFIFMTGHANQNNNVGEGRPRNQAELIVNFCEENNQFCLDYYGIDTHDMEDNYWEDSGDDGNSNEYGGNFYQDWQNDHAVGNGYFENKSAPDGEVRFGQHNSQHLTANRKAYAFWYILARIAGWDGETAE